MTDRPALLGDHTEVVTAGVELFDAALHDQGVVTRPVDWRPPLGVDADVIARVAGDPRRADADRTAVGRLVAARPRLVGVSTARDALGIDGPQFLHAGPPISWADASGPLRGALIGGVLLEGLADDAEAAAAVAARELELAPCHHHDAVGPMAGVVTPSMPVLVVRDEVSGRTGHCTLNEGLGDVLRYGAFGPDVLDRLRWMADVLGPTLGDVISRTDEPLDVRAMVAQALQMGDEGHNRNRAATSLFLRHHLGALVADGRPSRDRVEVARFIDSNDHFALNVVMAGAKAAADSARDVAGSSLVVAMARNGTEFGVQLSGTGDQWFTAPASVPQGLLFPGFTEDDVNPDIGDSTITETWGLGGCAMACAPAIVRFVGGTVDEALATSRRTYDITLAEHPQFQIPVFEFRGTPTGIDALAVVATGTTPPVNTGMAGRVAGTGQVGAGLASPPLGCFADAVAALASAVTSEPPSEGTAP